MKIVKYIMFIALVLFIFSIIVEGLLLYFTSPDTASGGLNHLFIVLFSLNSGILLGSMFTLILFLVFYFMKAYDEITNHAFIRRGILFGVLVSLLLLGKFYGVLDRIIVGLLIAVLLAFEIIMSRRDRGARI